MNEVWWDCGEPYTMPAITNITYADGQRDIRLPILKVIWQDGNVGMDGSSHPELLHYLCSELREQDQPKSHIDIWSFYVYSHFIGLSAILKSEIIFKFYFKIQDIKPKDLLFVWVTLRAWLSNFLAETGLRIHSSSVLGNTDTAFQTAVILQISVLRHMNKGSVFSWRYQKGLKLRHS